MADQRDDIERLDKEIMDILSRRSELYIHHLKSLPENSGLFSPVDRTRLFSFVEHENRGPLPADLLKRIFIEMTSACMSQVAPVTVAFLGPEGTFTNMAVKEFFGEYARELPQRTIQDVFQQVEAGAAMYGVVPIENSTEGGVTYTLDELIETNCTILSEKYIKITYSLLSLSNNIEAIKKIYTHSQTFGQCKGWIRANLPNAEVVCVDSTSLAAEIATNENDAAAISSGIAGEIYNLNTLATMIEDSRQNYTRFFLIGMNLNHPTGDDKTSIVCAVKDKPGALLNLLKPFSEAGINMTKIESRPDKKKMWAYNFFIDINGHIDDIIVKKAIDEIKEETIFLKILGSYPVGS